MKILAFAASNSLISINHQLITYATSFIQSELPEAEIEIIHLSDYEIPFYRPDREEADGVPVEAQTFYDKIGSADGLVISFAEHNGSYTAAYKNLLDWTSRIDIKVYQDKPAVLLSSSPGRGGAGLSLQQGIDSSGRFGLDVRASASLPSFNHTFDKENVLIADEEHKQVIDTALQAILSM